MIDGTTADGLKILTSEGGASMLRLSYARLEEVESSLKANGVRYWLSEDIYSFNGSPEKTIIHFGYNKDTEQFRLFWMAWKNGMKRHSGFKRRQQ